MSKVVPDIRFNKFIGNWEVIKLRDATSNIGTGRSSFVYNELSKENPFAILGSTSIIGYDNDYDYEGDFILTARVGANAGNLYCYSGKVKISDNTVFIQGKHLSFLYPLLTYFNLKKLSFGTGQPLIKASELKNLKLKLPSFDEEKKVGEFFKGIDEIIKLQQQLLNDHKQLKKAMLQKMFPQKGESVPKIRFDEFSGDWKKRKINDLVTLIVREVPKPKNSYKRLSIRSHAKGTFQRIVEDPTTVAMDKLYLVKENDLIVNITFAWEHAIAIAKKEDNDLLVSHRFPTYVIDRSDINFIKELVSKESFRRLLWLISPGGAGRNRVLNKKDFGNLGVLVPISIEEQQKIGDFFKQLDETITLNEQKLEIYQELKKAMLQKMFV